MENAHTQYDDVFFDEVERTAGRSAAKILPLFFESLKRKPSNVIDVGCGVGCWLDTCIQLGITDVLGVDGSYVQHSRLRFPADCFLVADLSKPLVLERKFELAICVEVAEHLDKDNADILIKSLVDAADLILFSAAIPGQGGTHHVNEQWPDYWCAKFDSHGSKLLDLLRYQIWEDNQIAWWYRQNILIACRYESIESLFKEESCSRMLAPVRLIHPELYIGTQYAFQELQTLKNELTTENASLTSAKLENQCLQVELSAANNQIENIQLENRKLQNSLEDINAILSSTQLENQRLQTTLESISLLLNDTQSKLTRLESSRLIRMINYFKNFRRTMF